MGHAAAEGQTIAIEIGRKAADGIAAPPHERFENRYDRVAVGDEPTRERKDHRGHETRTGNRCKQTDEERTAKGIAELAHRHAVEPSVQVFHRRNERATRRNRGDPISEGITRAVGSASEPRSVSLRDFAAAAQPSGDQDGRNREGYAADQFARAVMKVVVAIGGQGIVAHDIDCRVRKDRSGSRSA